MSVYNSKERLSKNFTRGELECPHCHMLPSKAFIRYLQEFRTTLNKRMRISSGCRCQVHNTAIGGYKESTHMVVIEGEPFGTVDVKHGRYNNSLRWALVKLALTMGFNNIEVCNLHTHLGIVPPTHPGYNKIIWGTSK